MCQIGTGPFLQQMSHLLFACFTINDTKKYKSQNVRLILSTNGIIALSSTSKICQIEYERGLILEHTPATNDFLVYAPKWSILD